MILAVIFFNCFFFNSNYENFSMFELNSFRLFNFTFLILHTKNSHENLRFYRCLFSLNSIVFKLFYHRYGLIPLVRLHIDFRLYGLFKFCLTTNLSDTFVNSNMKFFDFSYVGKFSFRSFCIFLFGYVGCLYVSKIQFLSVNNSSTMELCVCEFVCERPTK